MGLDKYGEFTYTVETNESAKEDKGSSDTSVEDMIQEQKKSMEALFAEALSTQDIKELISDEEARENETDIDWLLRRFREIIQHLESDEISNHKDVVSNATYLNAGRMLKVGIPREAILFAYALSWPAHMREKLEIESFDPLSFEHEDFPHREGQHRVVPYVEALIRAKVPTMLIGPTQAGKGFLSRNIAENRGIQYGSVPLSAGTSISWLFGRNMPQGFVETDLIRCYEEGGVFLLDEMDAADANLLIGINDALSNDELANPVVDKRICKHEDFVPIAAANTFGLGADADYAGRERLDMATLERWRMGRVCVEYDRGLQENILRNEAE